MQEYLSKTTKSRVLYERAKRVLPAGVSYGIRNFEPYPFYTIKAKGSKLYDADGNKYIDFWLGHTTLILGHSPPIVVQAVEEQLRNGTQYGTCHELEILLAEQMAKLVPSAEMTRFTNSGTEANMYATRLARAFMRKDKIAKFEGGWHGGYDALHKAVKYPFDCPESAGLTVGSTGDTIALPYNDLIGVEKEVKRQPLAAIIVEPVQGSGGGIPAEKEFLVGLRELCDMNGILLVFDEVITGFRLAPGGAQQYFGVTPDITVFGKILGGGFPVGAFSGRTEIMNHLNSLLNKRTDYSFHGGTFCGNPITMAAGLATLRQLEDGRIIDDLNKKGARIRQKLARIFLENAIDCQVVGAGSIFNAHFTPKRVKNAVDANQANKKMLFDYELGLIASGVFLLPTHNGVICSMHSNQDFEKLFAETENFARQQHCT